MASAAAACGGDGGCGGGCRGAQKAPCCAAARAPSANDAIIKTDLLLFIARACVRVCLLWQENAMISTNVEHFEIYGPAGEIGIEPLSITMPAEAIRYRITGYRTTIQCNRGVANVSRLSAGMPYLHVNCMTEMVCLAPFPNRRSLL